MHVQATSTPFGQSLPLEHATVRSQLKEVIWRQKCRENLQYQDCRVYQYRAFQNSKKYEIKKEAHYERMSAMFINCCDSCIFLHILLGAGATSSCRPGSRRDS